MSERPWSSAGSADLWREGRGRAVEVDGTIVAIFRSKGRWIALDDTCPHMGASLAAGYVAGDEVQCSWHEWRYDVATGQCGLRPWAKVRVWETKVEEGTLFVRPPEGGEPAPPDEEEPDWVRWDPERFFRKKEEGAG